MGTWRGQLCRLGASEQRPRRAGPPFLPDAVVLARTARSVPSAAGPRGALGGRGLSPGVRSKLRGSGSARVNMPRPDGELRVTTVPIAGVFSAHLARARLAHEASGLVFGRTTDPGKRKGRDSNPGDRSRGLTVFKTAQNPCKSTPVRQPVRQSQCLRPPKAGLRRTRTPLPFREDWNAPPRHVHRTRSHGRPAQQPDGAF